MSDHTLCHGKGLVPCRNSEVSTELSNKDTLACDLHDDWGASSTSDVATNSNSRVVIVDWDGPNDSSNPKK